MPCKLKKISKLKKLLLFLKVLLFIDISFLYWNFVFSGFTDLALKKSSPKLHHTIMTPIVYAHTNLSYQEVTGGRLTNTYN